MTTNECGMALQMEGLSPCVFLLLVGGNYRFIKYLCNECNNIDLCYIF